MKGAFVTYLGGEEVFAPFGGLSEEEANLLREAMDRLPEEFLASEWDALLLLLTEEGVTAHRYAWREQRRCAC